MTTEKHKRSYKYDLHALLLLAIFIPISSWANESSNVIVFTVASKENKSLGIQKEELNYSYFNQNKSALKKQLEAKAAKSYGGDTFHHRSIPPNLCYVSYSFPKKNKTSFGVVDYLENEDALRKKIKELTGYKGYKILDQGCNTGTSANPWASTTEACGGSGKTYQLLQVQPKRYMLKSEDGRSTYIDLATKNIPDLENPKSSTANKMDGAIQFVCDQTKASKTSITALMRKLLQREKEQCKESDSKHCFTVKSTQAPAGVRG